MKKLVLFFQDIVSAEQQDFNWGWGEVVAVGAEVTHYWFPIIPLFTYSPASLQPQANIRTAKFDCFLSSSFLVPPKQSVDLRLTCWCPIYLWS